MSFKRFFAKQAERPSGLFGRLVMSSIFNYGNAFLNNLTLETLEIKPGDHVLDVGCGTGKLVRKITNRIGDGIVEGIDYSPPMVSVARKKNRKEISRGRVNIISGDVTSCPFESERFDKICTVNTIYFWAKPESLVRILYDMLKPGGILVIAFEDIQQLEQRTLDRNVFHLYRTDQVNALMINSGFSKAIEIVSKRKGDLCFHCVVARK